MKILLLATLALSISAHAHEDDIPHLDLEMSSVEYRAHLKNLPKINAEPAIESAIRVGQRLSDWIGKINQTRSPENQIRLSSEASRVSYPISKPHVYSPQIIKDKQTEIFANIPKEMKDVLLGLGEVPSTLSMNEEVFIGWARIVDRNYQAAARYKTLNVYRSSYISRADKDVRGYYYLVINDIKAQDLRDRDLITSEKVTEIKDALNGICRNSATASSCPGIVAKAWSDNKLSELYEKYIKGSEEIWKKFFIIPKGAPRRDFKWVNNQLNIVFNTPSEARFIPYLRDNIEDEFRWKDWGLKMNFGKYRNGPKLVFEKGVVPHVNKLGGNIITMDSNQPIEEYESQWIIRHEFGHVLGLPDCYHEFYDTEINAYVSYQLDTSDLMCSRSGSMNERIYNELKRVYKK